MANLSSSSPTVLIDVNSPEKEPQYKRLRELDGDAPLRLLVLGDFSGKSTGKLLRIDRDNLESTLHSFAPRIELTLGSGQLGDAELTFLSSTDFEPDSLYRRSDLFRSFRDHSGQPLYSEPEENLPQEPAPPSPEQIQRLTSPGGLLDAVIEKSAGHAPKASDEFQAMVERIVAPYATPLESAESRRAATERLQRLNLLMNHILHDEQFQALESSWRGLDLLVRGLDTDERIHLYLFDISRDQLAAEMKRSNDIRDSDVYRTFTDNNSARWGLLVGNFAFDRDSIADVELLARIGLLAQSLRTPFIAEWTTSPHEDNKAEFAFEALRKSSCAPYLGLALPRFLLRLPYGKDTARVESFEFEEMPGQPVHTHYLWGNPVFACALVLGQLFEEQGSLDHAPGFLRLDGMPLHTFRAKGELQTRPCTEVLLSDNDCQTLLEEGVLPLVAVKSSDSIVFPKMLSISDPPKALAGF